jgi:hypothetical protein
MRKSRLSEEQIIAIIKVWIGAGIGPPPSALNSLIRREFLLFDEAPPSAPIRTPPPSCSSRLCNSFAELEWGPISVPIYSHGRRRTR